MRRLLVLFAVLGAGVSFGQPSLTASEVLGIIYAGGGGWTEQLEGTPGTYTSDDWTIYVDAYDFRTAAIAEFENKPGAALGGPIECGVLELGTCDHPGAYVYMGYVSEGGIRTPSNCTDPSNPYKGILRLYSGSQDGLPWCSAALEGARGYVLSAGDGLFPIYARVSYQDRTGTLLVDIPDTRVTCEACEFPTEEEFWTSHFDWVSEGISYAMPSVTELEASWGVVISESYTDGGYGDGGEWEDEGGGDPGGGGGGTDWQEGEHRTRCDGTGELNIFEKALFFAFEPCEDWPSEFLATSQDGQTKFPFGFQSWLPCLGTLYQTEGVSCAGPGSGEGVVLNPTGSLGGDLEAETPGFGFGAPFVLIPAMEIGAFTFPAVEFDLRDNPAMEWWVVHGKVWLWWLFVATFYISIFMRVFGR